MRRIYITLLIFTGCALAEIAEGLSENPGSSSLLRQKFDKRKEPSGVLEIAGMKAHFNRIPPMSESVGENFVTEVLDTIQDQLTTFLGKAQFDLQGFEVQQSIIWAKLMEIETWAPLLTASREYLEYYECVKLTFMETAQAAEYLKNLSKSARPLDRIIGSMIGVNFKLSYLHILSKEIPNNITMIECKSLELWQTIAALSSQYDSYTKVPLDKRLLFEAEEARANMMLENLKKFTKVFTRYEREEISETLKDFNPM